MATWGEVVPISGGDPVASFPIPRQADIFLWSPDGASFTFIDKGDPAWNLARIRPTGGAPERLTRFADGRVTRFAWSPDGTRLAIARRVGDMAGVWVSAADGAKPVQVARFQADEVFGLDWTPGRQTRSRQRWKAEQRRGALPQRQVAGFNPPRRGSKSRRGRSAPST